MKRIICLILISILLFLTTPVLFAAENADVYTISVSTDKGNYVSGNVIALVGLLKKNGTMDAGIPVAAIVKNPDGDVVYATQIRTDASGAYQDSFKLKSESMSGTYTVSVTAAAVTQETTFRFNKTQDNTVPQVTYPTTTNGGSVTTLPETQMPSIPQNVYNIPNEILLNNISFKDIAKHWAESDIKTLVKQGIISGYPDKTFRPNQKITRAEFAKIVLAAKNITPDENYDIVFADAHKIPAWAMKYIAAAYKAGLIKGYKVNGKIFFNPEQYLTRTEIAVMLVRAIGMEQDTVSQQKALLPFKDLKKIPAWARGYVAIAYNSKIIKGKNFNFAPDEKATRAECTSMVLRMMSK